MMDFCRLGHVNLYIYIYIYIYIYRERERERDDDEKDTLASIYKIKEAGWKACTCQHWPIYLANA